jgi:hypothetical protein
MKKTADEQRMVDKAVIMAANAHRYQVDKAGEAYLLHPVRVCQRKVFEVYGDVRTLRPQTANEMVVSLLHDVLEDSTYILGDLIGAGFPEECIDALVAMTHGMYETNEDYWARVKANPIARRIKYEDIADNINRLGFLANDDALYKRLQRKYAAALHALREVE